MSCYLKSNYRMRFAFYKLRRQKRGTQAQVNRYWTSIKRLDERRAYAKELTLNKHVKMRRTKPWGLSKLRYGELFYANPQAGGVSTQTS